MTQSPSLVTEPTAYLPPWVPLWETGTWQDEKLLSGYPPMQMWPWAFSCHQGIPIMLETKWSRTKDQQGNTTGWQQDASKLRNPHKDLRLSWDQVQKAVDISRRDGVSLKTAVASLIDRNDPSVAPGVFVNFAMAPEVKVAAKEEAVRMLDAKAQQAAADAYWAKVEVQKPKKG